MPLEATMMIIDNSEYMRNGDYLPSRFDAQADAVNIVFQTKADSNPENSVGVMSMGGKGAEVLLTHSRELGQVIQAVHDARSKMGGSADLRTAINVAQLALKHRQNKNLRQRIIVFLGSPVADSPGMDEKSLEKLAKKLKKNNIAIDIVCFGDAIEKESEDESEKPLLKVLVDGANSGDNSHLVNAPPDPRHLLSDMVLSSAVLSADRGDRDQAMAEMTNPTGGGGGAADFDEFGGVDPNLDPELAMVLRMSLEEERARRAREEAAAGPSGSSAPSDAPAVTASSSTPAPAAVPQPSLMDTEIDPEEEAALQEALRLSQQNEDVEMGDSSATKPNAPATGAADEGEEMEEDEEAAIARAIAMSMQPEEQQKK